MERKMPKLVPLPKEETPAPLAIPKREPKEKPEIIPEEIPALETAEEPAPVEKPDTADARAEALIMAHTAKTATKKKHNAAFLFLGIFIGLAIAIGILFTSGAINLDFLKKQPTESGSSGPNLTAAGSLCTGRGYKWGYIHVDEDGSESDDVAPFIGGEEIKEYVSKQRTCRPEEYTEESSFEFTYMALKDEYTFNNIKELKDTLATLAEYQKVLEDSDEFFKIVSRNTSPFIYLVAYKSAVVELYANDIETAENVLKELGFPDRAHNPSE